MNATKIYNQIMSGASSSSSYEFPVALVVLVMNIWRPACRHKVQSGEKYVVKINYKVTSYRAQSLRPGVLVTPERSIPCLPMLDQRPWVAHPIRQLGRRVVYLGSKHVAKLGNKCTDIIAARISFFALGVRIEDAKIWLRVRASACTPLPTAVVRGKIAVYELLHEMLWVEGGGMVCSPFQAEFQITYSLSQTPINHQVLCQIHRCNHAYAIVHPALRSGVLGQLPGGQFEQHTHRVSLSDPSIYDGHSRAARRPSFKMFWI
jgi:hypothetical protein